MVFFLFFNSYAAQMGLIEQPGLDAGRRLLEAVRVLDAKKVEQILKVYECDVEYQDDNGRTSLALAFKPVWSEERSLSQDEKKRQKVIIGALLKRGACINDYVRLCAIQVGWERDLLPVVAIPRSRAFRMKGRGGNEHKEERKGDS